MIERQIAYEIVLASIEEALRGTGVPVPENMNEETVLVGKDAVVDSMGVVALIVEVEQRLETEHGILVTLANDRAMSQKNSPFRTVRVLTDHVMATAQESLAQ